MSVCLAKCIMGKRYIRQQKCLTKWIVNDFTVFNLKHRQCPLKLPTPKFQTFACLLYLTFWDWLCMTILSFIYVCFILCCYEHGRILLSRWPSSNTSYSVRSAFSATAAFLVLILSNILAILSPKGVSVMIQVVSVRCVHGCNVVRQWTSCS